MVALDADRGRADVPIEVDVLAIVARHGGRAREVLVVEVLCVPAGRQRCRILHRDLGGRGVRRVVEFDLQGVRTRRHRVVGEICRRRLIEPGIQHENVVDVDPRAIVRRRRKAIRRRRVRLGARPADTPSVRVYPGSRRPLPIEVERWRRARNRVRAVAASKYRRAGERRVVVVLARPRGGRRADGRSAAGNRVHKCAEHEHRE